MMRPLFAATVIVIAACAADAHPVPAPPHAPSPNRADYATVRTDEVLERARTAPPARVVFVGDSITQGFENEGASAWAEHIAPLGALNLGCTGDRTEHVRWRLAEAPLMRLQPAHIVLLLGTNDLGHGTANADGTFAGVVAVVRMLREQCPAATLHLHTIFPRDVARSPLREAVRDVNARLVAFVRAEHARDAASAARLVLHTTGEQFVQPDGSIPAAAMPDGLHLSAASYATWAAAIAPFVRR